MPRCWSFQADNASSMVAAAVRPLLSVVALLIALSAPLPPNGGKTVPASPMTHSRPRV
jgi:hypothetical protein